MVGSSNHRDTQAGLALEDLTPRQEEFARLYYAGPDHLRGNGRRCYLEAYETDNPQSADTGASRLLRNEKVRARIEELREEAAKEAKTRAKDWWELYPEAQETLLAAAEGEAPGETPQDKRSAVEAAKEIVARCLGSVKLQHEHSLDGQAIVAHVAGAPAQPREEDRPTNLSEDRELPTPGPRIEAIEE